MDHYATLGVAKNATQDDIKKAYRRMAAIHHPDKGGDTAEFQKIQSAYETLSDTEKKQQYDNPNPYGGMPGGFPGGFPGGGFQFHTNGFNINERDGPNLYSTHEISVFDLVVGTKFNFTTISGRVLEVTVPAKSQPGSKLRLPKEGLPINNDYGDQYLLLKPFIPDIIDTRITDSILQSSRK